jgi:predicted O-linked N-acetylglucosamine transferase (SPINDLY family)/predicted SAM-dependent methyltransferase
LSWLKRVLGGGAAPAPAGDAWAGIRGGFDCELRGDVEGAAQAYRAAVEQSAGDDVAAAQALYYLGRLAASDRREEEAITLFEDAVARCPDEALYQLALADALLAARRYPEAAAAYQVCRALQPEASVMANNYAGALIEMNRRAEARAELELLREIAPHSPEVHFNLGGIYREYCRTDDAIAAYRKALALKPGHAPTFSNLLLELNMGTSLTPQAVADEHRRFGEHFARRYAAPVPDRAWPRRLRIGYVSADFRNHVVSFFMEPILAHHDHARFEIVCYHTHHQKDRTTEQLRRFADRWVDCEAMSDAELAARIRADRIDILVDLGGHTADNRMLVFAEKPAPVQATYLGYPNTTGLQTIDYRITDAYADPPGESDRLSTERLVRLPHSYFCFRPGDDAPPVEPPPAAAAAGVTFGCFNHFAKISGEFLDTVAEVLKAVPGSRFILKGRPLSTPEVAAGPRARFERAGVDLSRIELRGWEPTSRSHLRIYGEVDIALDSFPYSGATTTCEALWMGVPVVNLAGIRHASRMCTSILTTVGLGEWIARDKAEYVAKAAALASDRARLAQLRATMRERLKASPLMDEAGFTRDLEKLYLEMWQRSVLAVVPAGEGPARDVGRLLEAARALRAEGRRMEAVEVCRAILEKLPGHFETLQLLWDAGFEAGIPGVCIEPLLQALALDDRDARLHYMLGCAFQAQEKAAEAIDAFERSIALDPGQAKAHNNLGCMLEAAGRLDEAAAAYAQAIALDAALAQAYFNAGSLQALQGDQAGAMARIERAIALEPRNAVWHNRLGELRYSAQRIDEAIAEFRAAIEIDEGLERAQANLGAAQLYAGAVEQAEAPLRRALEANDGDAALASTLLHLSHYRPIDPRVLFERHLAWARRHARGLVRFSTRALGMLPEGRPLNVGYVSPDFVAHPAAHFIEPVLAAHDRRAVKLFCYSNAGREDEVTRRLQALEVTWRDISRSSDFEAADRIRADGIDVLVDLAGHTGGGRPLLFAHRPAPLQVTWLGYPGTTGLDAIDFRLTDAVADPEGAERYGSERLWRLTDGFHCYLPPADAPEIAAPADLGDGHVTFASFNNLAKLTAEAVAVWARLLRELPKARLILKAHGLSVDSARTRVLSMFAVHGVAADRVDLLRAEARHARHMAKYHDVDIALDTFPYNGGTTTCEALWMGVPVVTLAGQGAAGRLGASLLHAAGLEHCVAGSLEQYVEIALQLARDPGERHAFRRAARARLRASPLMDARRFAGALEAAYRGMWEEKARAPAAPAPAAPEPSGPLRLHVGGKEPREGWKIVNIQAGPEVDFIADCTDLKVIPDGAVEEIYASHVLEHLGYQIMLPRALAEFHRVLRPGGVLRISVPDFGVICRLFADPSTSHDDRLLLMRMAFGGQTDPHDFHYVGLDFEILGDFLRRAGFRQFEQAPAFDLFVDASQAKIAGRAISLNVVARK